MKKTLMVIALLTLTYAAMASGCRQDINNCNLSAATTQQDSVSADQGHSDTTQVNSYRSGH